MSEQYKTIARVEPVQVPLEKQMPCVCIVTIVLAVPLADAIERSTNLHDVLFRYFDLGRMVWDAPAESPPCLRLEFDEHLDGAGLQLLDDLLSMAMQGMYLPGAVL